MFWPHVSLRYLGSSFAAFLFAGELLMLPQSQRVHLNSSSVEEDTHVMTQNRHVLSNRSQYVLVDGCCSKLVNTVSKVPYGSVLGPQLLLLYTTELFSIVENKLNGYANH